MTTEAPGEARSEVPATIGPYGVLARLGAGGMGIVYRAEHLETRKVVALKTAFVVKGNDIAGLRGEIRALSRVRHPGVVRILDEGVHDGVPWYAMELLEGRTLSDHNADSWGAPAGPGATTMPAVLPEAVTLAAAPAPAVLASMAAPALARSRAAVAGGDLPRALGIVRRLCAPLAFLHGAGIIHRDLKPANVFIRADGTPVIMDFGLVAHFEGGLGREVIEVAGDAMGTVAYMSPEQITGRLVDARADLYALGCMLHELLTGQPPFVGGSLVDILHRHLGEAPEPPSALVDGVPPELDALVLRLLAKQPRARVGHADDVAAALAALGADGDDASLADAPRPGAYLCRPELAGRQDVLDRLVARVRHAQQGVGGVVLVGGESGVGKTFLSSAVAREATVRGVLVVTGECLPVATPDAGAGDVRGAPLHPFRRLLEAIADRCIERGPEATRRLLGPRGKILAPYAPALRALPGLAAYPEPATVPAQAERQRLLSALGETLAAFAAEQPVLLVLDDLQWADELSLSLLASLDDAYFRERALLILGTYRAEEAGAALHEVLDAPGVERVALGRLDVAMVGAMVGDMLALDEVPAPFVRALWERSSGNPFFVAEYLRAAVAERLLHRADGAWRVVGAEGGDATYEALPLPRSLRDLVVRRLDGLPASALSLVEVAAVLGREAAVRVILDVADAAEADALDALNELRAAQVIEDVGAGRVRFMHDKLREIAAGRIPDARRRELHRRAAAAIEARAAGAGGVALLHSELAHHHAEAGDLASAIDHLDRGAAQAERSFANRDAARFLGDLLALDARRSAPADATRRASWERRLGNAYLGLGKLVESQEHLLRAVALLGEPVPASLGRLVPALARRVIDQVGHRLRPPRPERDGPARARLLEAARAYDLLMPVSAFVGGDRLHVLHAALTHLNLAERAGPSPELALAYANAQLTAGVIPWFSLADAYGRRVHEMLEGVADPAVRSWAYVLAGGYAVGVGDFETALDLGARVTAIAAEVGFSRRVEEGLGVLASAYSLRGDFGLAGEVFQQVWDSARRGDSQTLVWGAAGVAHNAFPLDDRDRALRAAEAAERALSAKAARAERILAYSAVGLARLRSGDRRGAREAAERASAAIGEGTPILFYCIGPYTHVAETLLELCESSAGEPPADRATLVRAARRAVLDVAASARVFPVHRARALLVEGRFEALAGRVARARRLWERAITAARAARTPHDEALAELLLAVGERDRRARISRARALLEPLGAAYDLARAAAME